MKMTVKNGHGWMMLGGGAVDNVQGSIGGGCKRIITMQMTMGTSVQDEGVKDSDVHISE